MSVADSIATESEVTIEANSDHELDISDDDDDDDDEGNNDSKEESKEIIEEETNTNVENCDMNEDSELDMESQQVTKDKCVCESASAEDDEQKGEDKVTSESATLSEDCDIQKDEERTKNVIKAKEESVKENQSATQGVEFPDTEISLQHIKGDK